MAPGLAGLVDCGLFQGQKEWRERNWQDLPIPANTIDAVILTHAHLDHSGWIPRLVKEGFHGPIYATPPTIDLCSILLPDSGHLQEEDAAFYNKTSASKHHPALPLYTLEEAQQCLTLFRPVNFGEAKQLRRSCPSASYRAAHILGSCHGGGHGQRRAAKERSFCLQAISGACATARSRPARSSIPARPKARTAICW